MPKTKKRKTKKRTTYKVIKKEVLSPDNTEYLTPEEASHLSDRSLKDIKTWIKENRLPVYKQFKKKINDKWEYLFIKRKEFEAFLLHADRGLDLSGEIYESIESCAKDLGMNPNEVQRLIHTGYLDPIPLPFKKKSGNVEAVGVSKQQIRDYIKRQEGYDINTFGTVFKIKLDEDIVALFKERLGNSFPRRISDWLHEIVYDAICEGKHEEWIYERT